MSEKNSSRGVQLLLRAVTVLLCLLLFFSTAAAVLLADVRLLTSRGACSPSFCRC